MTDGQADIKALYSMATSTGNIERTADLPDLPSGGIPYVNKRRPDCIDQSGSAFLVLGNKVLEVHNSSSNIGVFLNM